MASGDQNESLAGLDTVSHHLTNTMHIIENILKYKNAKELNLCARVCSSWAKVVKKLRNRRRTRSWTCLSIPAGTEDISPITEGTRLFFQELYTQPDTVFMMCETDLLLTRSATYVRTRSGRAGMRTLTTFQDFVRSLLPQSCKLFGVESGGIVGTSSDCRQGIEVENDARGVSFLCLPKYDGVDITINEDIDDKDSDVKLQQYINSLSEPEKPACKAILMLISDFQAPRKYGFDLMKAVPDTLVAGAYVENVFTMNCADPETSGTSQETVENHDKPVQPESITITDSDKEPMLQLATIRGDRVQIASVIINETVDTAEDAEECVKKLKSHKLPEENSFAFMFACLGRGEGLYAEPNIESSIFRRYFPKTPLIGLFGNGEIGFELVNKGSSVQGIEPECKKMKSPPTLYHPYTTVLVLVSIT